MNCEQFDRSIHDYLAETLAEHERQAFEQHRASCSACRARAEQHESFCCRKFVEFLDHFLADEVPPVQREVFERHLRLCPPCGIYLESYRLTVTLARECRGGQAGPDLGEMPEELVRAILDALEREP